MRQDDNARWQAGERFDPWDDGVPIDPSNPENGGSGVGENDSRDSRDRWGALNSITEPALPPFPVDALHSHWGTYVSSLAASTQTPVDMPAMVLLGVLATALQGKYRIRGKPGWVEPLCLWPVVALDPGNRKSAVHAAMFGPVYDAERQLRADAEPRRSEAMAQRDALAGEIKRARKRTVKAGATDEDREDLARLVAELANAPEPFDLPILVAMDATPEAIGVLLERQGRITLASAEGNEVFAIAAGRYSERANYDLLLKAHAGDTHTVHRINRDSLHIPRAIASLVLAVQPDVLRGLDSGMRGRGLLGRVLFSLPASPLGVRTFDSPEIPAGVSNRYDDGVRALLGLPGQRDERGAWDARLIDLSLDARAVAAAWHAEVEPRLGPDGDLADYTDWGGKLEGATLRIAGLLHAAERPHVDPAGRPVTAETYERAVRVARYLVPHALAAFGLMGGHGGDRRARRVLAWLRRRGELTFTESDLQQDFKTSIPDAADRRAVLLDLAARNYLAESPPEPRKGPGRKPSPTWHVNPAVLR